jgi:hypothetical protein
VNSPVHYAKGTPSHVAGCPAIVLRPLVSARFQVLFTRLVAVLFIVRSPYWFAIGHRGVFSLGRWAARLRTEFHELRATLVRLSQGTVSFRLRDCHPLWRVFPDASARIGFVKPLEAPATPPRRVVWASPLSLAATDGIDVSFYSCGYLDVSVPRVRSAPPIHSAVSNWRSSSWVSPFGNLRIDARLPASRSLSQATTSFVASRCQDIHRAPLVA